MFPCLDYRLHVPARWYLGGQLGERGAHQRRHPREPADPAHRLQEHTATPPGRLTFALIEIEQINIKIKKKILKHISVTLIYPKKKKNGTDSAAHNYPVPIQLCFIFFSRLFLWYREFWPFRFKPSCNIHPKDIEFSLYRTWPSFYFNAVYP